MYSLRINIYDNNEVVASQAYVCESVEERESKKNYTLDRAKKMSGYLTHFLSKGGTEESLSVYLENGEAEINEGNL